MPHRVKGACRSPATRAMTFNSFDDDGRPVRYLLLRLQPVSVGIDHVWGGARHIWGSSPFVVVESTLSRRPTGRPMTPTGRVSVEAHSVIPQLLPIESEGTAQQHGDVDCRCCRRCRWIDGSTWCEPSGSCTVADDAVSGRDGHCQSWGVFRTVASRIL